MTTPPYIDATTSHTRRTLVLLLSLIMGVAGVLGTLWFFSNETTGLAQLANLLGITKKTPWYFTRSAGSVAYLLLAGSTIWGLLLSSKIIKEAIPAPLALEMHKSLSWLAIGLSGLHGLALLFDNYYTYTPADLTIPFIGPYRPGWVGLGIIGLYLMVVVSASFSFRKQLGQKRWRQLHTLTFVAYLFATIHGIMAGSDSSQPLLQVLYWGSGLVVLFLTNYRLVTMQKKSR